MTEPQSKTAQRRIIEAATADGTLSSLRWYMVAEHGGKSTPVGVNGMLPVVSVAPDPAVTEHYAHLMLEIFKFHAPLVGLHIELTAVDILVNAGTQWYEFGTEDPICPMCAGVGWESCCCAPNLWRTE